MIKGNGTKRLYPRLYDVGGGLIIQAPTLARVRLNAIEMTGTRAHAMMLTLEEAQAACGTMMNLLAIYAYPRRNNRCRRRRSEINRRY